MPLAEETGDGGGHGVDPDDPESLALAARDRALLNRLIGELPPEYREVVVLRELEELSYREIAAIVAIPIGTVMSRLARARARLRRDWRRLCQAGSDHGA